MWSFHSKVNAEECKIGEVMRHESVIYQFSPEGPVTTMIIKYYGQKEKKICYFKDVQPFSSAINRYGKQKKQKNPKPMILTHTNF